MACPRAGPAGPALLALAYLRQGHTYEPLAPGFGISTATAARRIHEAVDLLSAQAPRLRAGLRRAKRSGRGYVILDGTLPDGTRDDDGWMGDFYREPVVVSVHQIFPDPGEYRVFGNDEAGLREICTLTDEPDSSPTWRGRWNDDEWCDRIASEARKLIANPRPI